MPAHQNSQELTSEAEAGESPVDSYLLKIAEGSEYLRMHPRSVYDAINRGETFGDSVRRLPGKRLRFSRKRLIAYCNGEIIAS